MGAVVSFRSVVKAYGDYVALHPTSFDIAAGEFFSLIGPSGSGKSTLLGVTAGFIAPSGGSVVVNDVDIVSVPPYKRNIGMVFQNYALFPFMTVAENIAFPLKMRGVPSAERRSRVARMMEVVRLSGMSDRKPSQLSGGQQQRVALARAAVYDPSILLMDEPLGALDKNLREEMQEEIRQFQSKLESTVIYVTHDQNEATSMSHRIGILNHGRVEQIGSPKDLYEKPRNRFVASFLGEANLFPVAGVRSPGAEIAEVKTCEDVCIKVAVNRISSDPGFIVVRPEVVRIANARTTEDENCFQGEVVDVVYTAGSVRYKVKISPSLTVVVRKSTEQGATLMTLGQHVCVSWSPTSCSVTNEK